MNRFRFVHLNVHSHYSINDGCASIKELVDTAIKDKMPGVAITDNGNMYIFAGLKKDASLDEHLKYNDKFLSPDVFQWESILCLQVCDFRL